MRLDFLPVAERSARMRVARDDRSLGCHLGFGCLRASRGNALDFGFLEGSASGVAGCLCPGHQRRCFGFARQSGWPCTPSLLCGDKHRRQHDCRIAICLAGRCGSRRCLSPTGGTSGNKVIKRSRRLGPRSTVGGDSGAPQVLRGPANIGHRSVQGSSVEGPPPGGFKSDRDCCRTAQTRSCGAVARPVGCR